MSTQPQPRPPAELATLRTIALVAGLVAVALTVVGGDAVWWGTARLLAWVVCAFAVIGWVVLYLRVRQLR